MKAWFVLALFLVACGGGDVVAPEASEALGCDLSTNWPGDEACLPPTDGALALHFGPADYDDPHTTTPFLMVPGGDATFTVDVPIDGAAGRFVSSYVASSRPGNHHLTLLARRTGTPSSTFRAYTTALPGESFIAMRHDGSVVSFSHPPEYENAAVQVPEWTTSWVLDVHYLNTTSSPILMEGWIQLDVVDEPGVVLSYFQGSGGIAMNVPPNTKATVQAGGAKCVAPSDVSLVTLVGHQHSHGAALRVSVGGELVYRNSDWEHALPAVFASGVENPPLDGASGARSGVVHVPAGTQVSWQCDVDNTLSTTIKYGANLQTAEMCAFAAFVTPPTAKPWGCVTQ